jgi:hypothetical protein
MPIKFQSLEESQLPRWVYALMKANQDPTQESDTLTRSELNDKAQAIYDQRMARLKAMSEQSNPGDGGRINGLAWKFKPKGTFTEKELDKIIPTRRASYVAHRGIVIGFIMIIVLIGTVAVIFAMLAACAEVKLGGNFNDAWAMFNQDPIDYMHRVFGTL